jgi:signal transduction histidine kinase
MSYRLPLRLRVAVAFAATTTVALVVLGVFVYDQVETSLVAQATNSLRSQLDALAEVPPESRAAAARAPTDDMYSQLLDLDGRLLAGAPQLAKSLVRPGELADDEGEVQVVERRLPLVDDGDETGLVAFGRYDDQVLVVAASKDDLSETLNEVRSQLLVGGPLLLLLASAIGYLVAGLALRPVEAMRHRAELISARHAGERLPQPAANDELRRLAVTLNEMLDRLESALARERRFVAEASHELRTPLALLRMELDLATSQPRSHEELLEAIRSADEEVERLTRLSEDLLLLHGSSEGRSGRDRMEVVDLAAVLGAVAARFATRAVAEGRQIRVSGGPGLLVRAHHDRLDRVVSNLVDNALTHGAGAVRLEARALDGRARIDVIDDGVAEAPAGVDPFETFAARPGARRSGGRGLGLSIARAIVEESGGSVTLGSPPTGKGTVATIELPLSGHE